MSQCNKRQSGYEQRYWYGAFAAWRRIRPPQRWLEFTTGIGFVDQCKTQSRMARASATLSAMTELRLGDGLEMSLSRASRTAAMMHAPMAIVLAKRSRRRSCSSRAMARLISPMRDSIGERRAKICTGGGPNLKRPSGESTQWGTRLHEQTIYKNWNLYAFW